MFLGLFFKCFLSVFQEGKQWQDGTFKLFYTFKSIFIPCFSFSAQKHRVLVSCGYHNKLPQNPWFKEQKFILSLSRGQKSGVKVAAGLNSLKVLGGGGGASCLCQLLVDPVIFWLVAGPLQYLPLFSCYFLPHVPNLPLLSLLRTPVIGLRAQHHPGWSHFDILNLITSSKTLF